ncbi:fasciclin domain-containing protein [Rhinopithecimicrobium faecis]|uniref:fasciclin domain-containing protein n=1 Tax=Rhinopithecimicrobium faecis TaxID=2820698 RepID=UPI0033654606
MKTHLKLGILLALITLVFGACNKDYYEETGVHNPKFEGSTWDYLNTRKDLFDTLTQVVKLAELEEVLKNEEVTFFAPADATIRRTLINLNRSLYFSGQDTVKQLNQVNKAVWKEYLSQYIVKKKFLLKDFTQIDTLDLQAYPGQGYLSYQGQAMNIGVLYNDVITQNSAGIKQTVKYAGYRQLYINYVFDFSNVGRTMITAPIATSDIQTKNGVLHVIQFSKHSFGFQAFNFVNSAISKGITYN